MLTVRLSRSVTPILASPEARAVRRRVRRPYSPMSVSRGEDGYSKVGSTGSALPFAAAPGTVVVVAGAPVTGSGVAVTGGTKLLKLPSTALARSSRRWAETRAAGRNR